MDIVLKIESLELKAQLNSSAAAVAFAALLPMTLRLSRWGDEYYGNCGVSADLTDAARDILEVGELAYWPPGSALCIFFGPTPASTDDRPRAASEVEPLGKIQGSVEKLKSLGSMVEVKISA